MGQAKIKDVKLALDRCQISWARWEFDRSFGLVFREDGRAVTPKGLSSPLDLEFR
ncbi:MAG: hypothetical protein PHU81_05685 [Acidobacteriota bacterium]|nr:hypothetical protein [Acidobacteriota bacterium]